EIAGDEARCAGTHTVGLGPCGCAPYQGLMEANREVVIAGKVDVGHAADADDPSITYRYLIQGPAQALPAARIAKGLVPAFASDHDRVTPYEGIQPPSTSRLANHIIQYVVWNSGNILAFCPIMAYVGATSGNIPTHAPYNAQERSMQRLTDRTLKALKPRAE